MCVGGTCIEGFVCTGGDVCGVCMCVVYVYVHVGYV